MSHLLCLFVAYKYFEVVVVVDFVVAGDLKDKCAAVEDDDDDVAVVVTVVAVAVVEALNLDVAVVALIDLMYYYKTCLNNFHYLGKKKQI